MWTNTKNFVKKLTFWLWRFFPLWWLTPPFTDWWDILSERWEDLEIEVWWVTFKNYAFWSKFIAKLNCEHFCTKKVITIARNGPYHNCIKQVSISLPNGQSKLHEIGIFLAIILFIIASNGHFFPNWLIKIAWNGLSYQLV